MRDEFSKSTSDVIAKRAGGRCSNPRCRVVTWGPRSDQAKSINVGVSAHITAAAPSGPRYDPAISETERVSTTNGVWLCQKCAKLIDNDPERYTVSVLRLWKEQAEADALTAIEGGTRIEAALPGHARLLQVSIVPGAMLSSDDLSGVQLFVKVANPGPRPVTVSTLELHVDGMARFAVPTPAANVRLPCRLDDGESCMMWVPARDFAGALVQLGCSGTIPFLAVVRDAVGQEFRSAPNEIDVEAMLRQ